VTDDKQNTNVESNTDEVLGSLYKKDKMRGSSPSAIRRSVMLAANQEALASSSIGTQFKRWMQTSKSLIAATAMVALVAVVWVGQYKLEQGAFNQNQYTNVQIHSLAEPQELASNSIRLKYDVAFKEFLLKQGTLAAHHQSSAKLRLNDNGWTLATCKNELLQISDELLNILKDVQRIDTDLVIGDSVNILFAMDGRIIQIVKSPEPLRC
jgi:hypothetical protein